MGWTPTPGPAFAIAGKCLHEETKCHLVRRSSLGKAGSSREHAGPVTILLAGCPRPWELIVRALRAREGRRDLDSRRRAQQPARLPAADPALASKSVAHVHREPEVVPLIKQSFLQK